MAGDSVNCWGGVLEGSPCLVLTHRGTRSRVQSSLWGPGNSSHLGHPRCLSSWQPLDVRGLARGEPGNRPCCELFESRSPVLKPVRWGHRDVPEAGSEHQRPPSSVPLVEPEGVAFIPCNDLSVCPNPRVHSSLGCKYQKAFSEEEAGSRRGSDGETRPTHDGQLGDRRVQGTGASQDRGQSDDSQCPGRGWHQHSVS